jgi:hypothetical protein
MNDRRPFQALTVVEEYTRVPLLTYVASTINSRDMIGNTLSLQEEVPQVPFKFPWQKSPAWRVDHVRCSI